jgi:chromatin remodeling complex protein RSC6
MAITLESLAADLKSIHRDIRKIRQILDDPTGEKAKARSENNGFKKPMEVDAVLSAFLGLNVGERISRSDVTKAVNKYASDNNLKNGQVINLDDKLRALLNPPEGEEVTFLKLQRYLAPHYVKSEPVAVDKKKPRVKA